MFTLSLTARKDLFDIVIFFARKPSFFIDRRPFWKLEAEKEVLEIFRQIGDRHSVAPTCAVLLTQVVLRWRASQVGTSWTRTTSTLRQARNSSEPIDLEHTLQGNWHDLNEFFEYATEWEPSASLYFGDNILQVRDNKILKRDIKSFSPS